MSWLYKQVVVYITYHLTHLPMEKDGRHFADDMFSCIFVNEKFKILIKMSLKFDPKGPIYNKPALV